MVIYLVCYDLGIPSSEQEDQIAYWLEFLNSTLLHSASTTGKCSIIIVGLGADKPNSTLTAGSTISILNTSWKWRWPQLPLYEHIFAVSSLQSTSSVQLLLKAINNKCNAIFQQHAIGIPSRYRTLMLAIKSESDNRVDVFSVDDLFNKFPMGMDPVAFLRALQYLHAIGRVVLLKDNLVCTNPSQIPKIAAKFIAPAEVQMQFLHQQAEVQMLSQEHIGCLLKILPHDPR